MEDLIAMGVISDTSTEEEVTEKAGFVVTIAGYSPYENILKLMDPAGVENNPDRWGFVTRLKHLGDVNSPFGDVNSPFRLYKRGEVEHLKLDTDPVGLETTARQNPVVERILQALEREASFDRRGITSRRTFVLRDPMTKEVVSRVAELDEDGKVKTNRRTGKIVYRDNDYWFVLNAKFIWKDAPKRSRASRTPWLFSPGSTPGSSG